MRTENNVKAKPKRGNIRVPAELHQKIKRVADKDRRSVNAMALLLIERGLSA